MMLHDAPAIRGIDAGPPSAVPSLPGRFDVELSQINAAMMLELARRHPQQMPKAVIDRAMPMSELKAACVHMGSHGVMGKRAMVNPIQCPCASPLTSVTSAMPAPSQAICAMVSRADRRFCSCGIRSASAT